MTDRLERGTCRFSTRAGVVPSWLVRIIRLNFLKYTTKENNMPFGICYVIKDNSEIVIVIVADPSYLIFRGAITGKVQSMVSYKVLLGLLNW